MQRIRVLSSAVTSLVLLTAVLATAQTIPPNVRLNTDSSPFLQNEEQVWINLTDSLNVVADWRDWRDARDARATKQRGGPGASDAVLASAQLGLP